MSWNDFHHREEILRVVVDTADEKRDGVLPKHVAGVTENFTDELDLVGALLLKWNARLMGNIERALMREPMDLERAVAEAWRTTAEQLPGVRMIIDRCTDAPASPEMERAMNRAHDRELAYLATAPGCPVVAARPRSRSVAAWSSWPGPGSPYPRPRSLGTTRRRSRSPTGSGRSSLPEPLRCLGE